MGMDSGGAAALQQGLDMTKDFLEKTRQRNTESDQKNLAEAHAALSEQGAMGEAYAQQREAKKAAADYREQAEKKRASAHANWGSSGLAMSGSKQFIRQSGRMQDQQVEDDILFQGDRDAQSTLKQARSRANLTRINNGASANRSTLALGSKLYKYGG
ncbi:hypothetical protein [Pseudodesulfovibrio sp.]|uniref:hypothetical protein n=1 Tax=unclassified Pseudodesulfovibrio TaxID=2661612 RepID=UPI003B00519B